MADGFKKYIYGTLLTGLFLFAMLGFLVQLAHDSDVDVSEISDSQFNITRLNNTFNSFTSQANSSANNAFNSPPDPNLGTLFFPALTSMGQVLSGGLLEFLTFFFFDLGPILNLPPIVPSVILVLIIIGITLSVYKLFKVGD